MLKPTRLIGIHSRSGRSRSRTPVALRDDRWPRPSREIRPIWRQYRSFGMAVRATPNSAICVLPSASRRCCAEPDSAKEPGAVGRGTGTKARLARYGVVMPRERSGRLSGRVCSEGTGYDFKDLAGVIAGHQVATAPEVWLAVGKTGGQLAGDGNGNLRVVFAVPQVDRRSHLIEAEAPWPGVHEQIGGHGRLALAVALPQVGDQRRPGIGVGKHALGGQPILQRRSAGQCERRSQ